MGLKIVFISEVLYKKISYCVRIKFKTNIKHKIRDLLIYEKQLRKNSKFKKNLYNYHKKSC